MKEHVRIPPGHMICLLRYGEELEAICGKVGARGISKGKRRWVSNGVYKEDKVKLRKH